MYNRIRIVACDRLPSLLVASLVGLLGAFSASAADLEPGFFRFQQLEYEIGESEGVVEVRVARVEGASGSVSVHYTVSGGSATAGSDFEDVEGVLSWENGESGTKAFGLEVLDDEQHEGTETVELRLLEPTGGAAILEDYREAVVFLVDDDEEGEGGGEGEEEPAGFFALYERTVEVFEDSGQAVVYVVRAEGDHGAVSVWVSTGDGTATPHDDFEPVLVQLHWEDGDDGERVVSIPILDDDAVEDEERFGVMLSDPDGGAVLHPERSYGTVVIGDDDTSDEEGEGGEGDGEDEEGEGDGAGDGEDDEGEGDDGEGSEHAGVLKLAQREFVVTELAGKATITVERIDGEDGAVGVSFRTASGGTATAGEDYTAVDGTLSWADGDGSPQTFEIPILADTLDEAPETVWLELFEPTGGALVHPERGEAVLVILDREREEDDDEEGDPGVLAFADGELQVIENEGRALVGVVRKRGATGSVGVTVRSSALSATAGEDFTASSAVLEWGAGEDGVRYFEVPILDDDLEEGNETVLLELLEPTGGASVHEERGIAELRILDDDGSRLACEEDEHTLCLLDGRFAIRVSWRTPGGDAGLATAVPQTDLSGLFWIFDPENIEILFKVLDGCDVPGFDTIWVFFAATTNLDFTVTVTDTATGLVKEYMNPAGEAADAVLDTFSFKTCS